jgi:integrase
MKLPPKLPKYVHGYADRHGKPRHYFRRRGYPKLPLPGLPWSPTFMAAYEGAMSGEPPPKREIGKDKVVPGTIADLIARYYQLKEWLELRDTSKATYRNMLERFRAENGHRRVASLDREKVEKMFTNRASTPSAANNWLDRLRILMQLAIKLKMRTDDPTYGIKPYRITSEGFKTWEPAYRAHYPLGTKQRLALELAYCTIQRRSDLVIMGPQHIRDGTLSITQLKTGEFVEIPVLPELEAALAAMPRDNLCFLVTAQGRPYTAAGFGGWFRDQCDAAGIPIGYSLHGLRKAGATRLAEHGATDLEIMAWGGWKTLAEVQRYTKKANRKRLAENARDKLYGRKPEQKGG